MKKKIILILLVLLVFAPFTYGLSVIFAEEIETRNIESELMDSIYSQLSGLDLSGVEDILKNLGNDELNIFGATSFFHKIQKLISGEFADGQASVFSAIVNLIFSDLLEFLPIVVTLIAIAVLCGFLAQVRVGENAKSTNDVIHFVCYGIIITIILGSVMSLVNMTNHTIMLLKAQIDVVFPLLLTILIAMGGAVSASVYQPSVALLSGTIIQLFTSLLMPVFIFTFVFSIISNLTSTVKFEKFTNFFSSSFKWILGGVFTIFTAFLSINGITAGAYDGVSVRTAKFALKSYIPLLGGYLSDGFDVIMTSSVLIKNAIGAGGLFLMFATIIMPIIKIVLFMLCLKLAAAILEPISDTRISSFIYMVAKSMTMLVVMIIGVSFMYLISVGLIMCTSNFV